MPVAVTVKVVFSPTPPLVLTGWVVMLGARAGVQPLSQVVTLVTAVRRVSLLNVMRLANETAADAVALLLPNCQRSWLAPAVVAALT